MASRPRELPSTTLLYLDFEAAMPLLPTGIQRFLVAEVGAVSCFAFRSHLEDPAGRARCWSKAARHSIQLAALDRGFWISDATLAILLRSSSDTQAHLTNYELSWLDFGESACGFHCVDLVELF